MDAVRPSCGEQSWHAREIVGGEINVEQSAEFADAAHLGLPSPHRELHSTTKQN